MPDKKEEIQVNLPDSTEVKEEKVVEDKSQQRSERKREQVEKMFVDHYGLEEGSDALTKLVDREMASAKSFDKLIKQKKKYRDASQKDTEPKETKPNEGDDEDKTDKSSFDKLRDIEKSKATNTFLQKLVNDYPEKFDTKEKVDTAYKNIMGEYKETGEETNRDDFKGNFKKAFRSAYPEIYEAEIKEKTRKSLLEDDVDLPDEGGAIKDNDKPTEMKFLKSKKVNPLDWYKKPKK